MKSFCSLTRLPVPFGLLHHRQRVVPRLSLRVSAEATDQPYMQPTAVPTDPQVNHRRVMLVKCDTEVNALKTKAARVHFCSPESKWGFFFFCWLLLVFHDCLKGWRTCIHPSCGDPQKDPEPMCSGNPGSVVVVKSRSCKHRGRSQSLSLHLLISWTCAIGFNNSLNLVNETS